MSYSVINELCFTRWLITLTSKQKFRFSLARPGQNGTFVLMSTGGFAQHEWSPCTRYRLDVQNVQILGQSLSSSKLESPSCPGWRTCRFPARWSPPWCCSAAGHSPEGGWKGVVIFVSRSTGWQFCLFKTWTCWTSRIVTLYTETQLLFWCQLEIGNYLNPKRTCIQSV